MFPIRIKRTRKNEFAIIKTPEELPIGEHFVILETNIKIKQPLFTIEIEELDNDFRCNLHIDSDFVVYGNWYGTGSYGLDYAKSEKRELEQGLDMLIEKVKRQTLEEVQSI